MLGWPPAAYHHHVDRGAAFTNRSSIIHWSLSSPTEAAHFEIMPETNSRNFPPELYDYVLDHLWDDRDTLEACSLTCRVWLPTSRFHLFYTVRVRSTCSIDRLRLRFENHPNIAVYVRELETPDFETAWILLPSLLPNIQHLTVTMNGKPCGLSNGKNDALLQNQGVLPLIKTLSLARMSVNRADLRFVFSIFSGLSALQLKRITAKLDSYTLPEDDNSLAKSGTHIGILSAEYTDQTILYYLLRVMGLPQVGTFRLFIQHIADIACVCNVLETAGGSLQELTISFDNNIQLNRRLVEYIHAQDFAHKNRLRSLHVHCIYAWRESAHNHEHDLLVLFLDQLKSPDLKKIEITLELYMFDCDDFAAVDWTSIIRCLTRIPHPRPCVVVNVHNRINWPGWTNHAIDTVADGLQGLQSEGVHLGVNCKTLARRADGPSNLEHQNRWIF